MENKFPTLALQEGDKVIICGDRNWCNSEIIAEYIEILVPYKVIVIEGECSGADIKARNEALKQKLKVIRHPAEWSRYGGAAGPIRNRIMLDEHPALVIAFHNDLEDSRGTKNMVGLATQSKICDVLLVTSKGWKWLARRSENPEN